MISIISRFNLSIYTTKNGFLVIESIPLPSEPNFHNKFVFRNVEELCEWLKEFYQKKPI